MNFAAMINSDFKDADGFKLQFEETIPEDEKKFYMKTFQRVDDVSKDRVHCTTCDCHVGTAPISEKIIRTHQVLNVTQCSKCYAFYNSGEFGKGEDGSEYYCRWCGQGGEVFCCSSCPFVFCNKCIRDNLTDAYVKEIEENDDWSCFVCNKDILKRLRAQHWALRNFMNKQLEKIQKVNINSEEELNNLLNDDQTSCCPKKKRKSILLKPAPIPIKRPLNGNQMISQPPAKRPLLIAPNKQIKIPVHASFHQAKPTIRLPAPAKRGNEVVCTPDILGLFNDKSSTSSTSAPPPLAMRQMGQIQRTNGPRSTTMANPIYHTVNGYQIDLNQASRQEIFRLPNGKLIQVRKQTNPTPTAAPSRLAVPVQNTPIAMPRATQYTIRPSAPNMTTSRMMRPAGPQMYPRMRAPTAQQRFSFSDGRVVSGGNNAQGNSAPTPTTSVASTIFTQQNGSISVARAPQPDTPFGKSKTAFEDRIIQGLEICQHTINKMITLTNSSSFKTSRSFTDLKELYIHLQYLFTYTSGKFKTLQENIVVGLEEIATQDKSLREKNGDDDDLEVVHVQQKVDIVEVLSDDEEAEKIKNAPPKEEQPSTVVENSETLIAKDFEEDLPSTIVEAVLEASPATPKKVINQIELLASLNVEVDDDKLKKRTAVKVERLEDSKSSVIKQFLIDIQQRRDAIVADEDQAEDDDMPDFPLVPEVVLEEGTDELNVPVENTSEVASEAVDCETQEKKDNTEAGEDIESPCGDEESSNTNEESPEPNEKEEQENIDNEEHLSQTSDDVMKIDNAPPADLMEVDEVIDSITTNEIIPDSPNESTKNVESILENGSNHENENENENEEQENMDNTSNFSLEEKSLSDEEQIKNVDDDEKNPIDDEKDLLDTLINSLDEPLASIDMDIPEALG